MSSTPPTVLPSGPALAVVGGVPVPGVSEPGLFPPSSRPGAVGMNPGIAAPGGSAARISAIAAAVGVDASAATAPAVGAAAVAAASGTPAARLTVESGESSAPNGRPLKPTNAAAPTKTITAAATSAAVAPLPAR